jgi:hypothetical protein
VDSRRVARGLLGAAAVALAALSVVLLVAALHRNAQITSLRRHGVPVEVTVTDCLGALGGSGSNAAGYSCRGAFVLDGHRYLDRLPGHNLLAPGSTIRLVAVKGNPGLIATRQQVETEHPSAAGFILPTVLLVVLAALMAAIVLWGRRRSAH